MEINRTAVREEKSKSPSQAQAQPWLTGWTAPRGVAWVGGPRARPVLAMAGGAPAHSTLGRGSGWVQPGHGRRPDTPTPASPAATCGALPLGRPGTPSGWSSWKTHAWPREGAELLWGKISPALNLVAPDISIPAPALHTRARTHAPLDLSKLRAVRAAHSRAHAGAGGRGEDPSSAGPGRRFLAPGSFRDQPTPPRPRLRFSPGRWHQPRVPLCSPGKPASTHPGCVRIPAASGSPLPHPTITAAPTERAMRSPASARPEPGVRGGRQGGRREEGERPQRGGAGGRRGARAPLPLAPGTRCHLRPLPASPVSRAEGPISARGGSRALRGVRSLARRAGPNSGSVRRSPKSANSRPRDRPARHPWGARLRARAGRVREPSPAGGTRRTGDLPVHPVPQERSKRTVFAQVAAIPSCERSLRCRSHPG